MLTTPSPPSIDCCWRPSLALGEREAGEMLGAPALLPLSQGPPAATARRLAEIAARSWSSTKSSGGTGRYLWECRTLMWRLRDDRESRTRGQYQHNQQPLPALAWLSVSFSILCNTPKKDVTPVNIWSMCMCDRGVNEKYSRNGRSGPGYIGRYAAVKQNSTRGVKKTRRVKHRLWH